ncbi:MAG: hypothetical protein ABL974_13995 [Prosthecobacter sp.]
MSDHNLPQELLAKARQPWITWCLITLFIIGLTAWMIGPRSLSKARSLAAQYYADTAETHLKSSEWPEATAALTLAQQWSSQNPRTLRVTADFLIAIDGEPASILHSLRLLDVTGQAIEADFLKMGQIYIQQQDIFNTQKSLDKLTAATRAQRPALELQANILRLQGRVREAEDTLRHALTLDKDDPICRLRLAIMDQQAAFIEMRQQGREIILQLSSGKDRAALIAIDFMANDSSLNSLEADSLLKSIEAHPDKTAESRLHVLSALIRVRPHQKEEILSAEVERYAKKGPEKLAPLLIWLLREHEPKRVLNMHTGDLFTKSPLLIEPYLQALAALDRWEEIDKTLSKPAGMPVSNAYTALWRARASQHINQGDITRTRQHLTTVYEASGHGRDAAAATAAGHIAEEAGIYDLAAKFYEGLSEHQPKSKLPMLEKVYEMDMRGHDTERVLQTAKRLLTLRPESEQYADRVTYLQLVAGYDLELNLQKVEHKTDTKSESIEHRLFQALAAYRMGDLASMRSHLSHLRDISSLSLGQRAVHAGLLSISGQVGPAYQMAEEIPSVLLLKEEKRFLDRAL